MDRTVPKPNKKRTSSSDIEQDEVSFPPQDRLQWHDLVEESREESARNEFGLTTTKGQAAAHPDWTHEQCKQEAAREYNRMNAARARVRNKKKLMGLKEKVAELKEREDELLRENGALRAQLDFYKNQKEATANAPPAPAFHVSACGHPSLLGMSQSSVTSQIGQRSNADPSFGILSQDFDTFSSLLEETQEIQHGCALEQQEQGIAVLRERLSDTGIGHLSGSLAESSSLRSTQEHAGLSSLASLVRNGLPPHLTALLGTTTGESSVWQG